MNVALPYLLKASFSKLYITIKEIILKQKSYKMSKGILCVDTKEIKKQIKSRYQYKLLTLVR